MNRRKPAAARRIVALVPLAGWESYRAIQMIDDAQALVCAVGLTPAGDLVVGGRVISRHAAGVDLLVDVVRVRHFLASLGAATA